MPGCQTGRHSIIHDHAVFTEHKSVTATSRLQIIPVVGVQQIEKAGGVRTPDINLAEGRCVQDADAVPCSKTFAVDRCVHILAFAGIEPGTFPLPYVFKTRASAHMPSVDRGLSNRIKKLLAKCSPSHRAEGHWRVVGTEGGRTHLAGRFAQRLGEDREAVDVAEFPLIGPEAERGIAFDVLDGAISLARSEPDIRRSSIVLEIKKFLYAVP